MGGYQGGSGDLLDDGYPDVVIKDSTGADFGVNANPFRVDPTGTTPQPASQSGSWTVNINNAAGGSAVNIQDGGNVISIDDAGGAITIDSLQLPVSLGQKTMTNSFAVVLASDQSAIPVSQSGTWNINNVSGTVSLPTGASTLAEQQTQTTSLQLIDDTVHAANAALNKGLAVGGQMDDTSTVVATENNVSVARITAQRAFHVNLRNNSGVQVGDITTPLAVLQKFQTGYVSGSVSVGTSAVEAKVGGSRVATRSTLYIENTGTTDIYYGPATVTTANGAILRRRQFVFLPVGDLEVQLISSAVGGTVIVQEMS